MPVIPDHELLRRIARGAYGEVWLARSVLGAYRAVKIVYRSSFDSDRPYEREFGGLQRFEPLSRSHPGLVNILHVGRNTEEGYFYSVMEAADDLSGNQCFAPETYRPRTLASEIAGRGRLAVHECARIGIGLAEALGYLHEKSLVHRDVKPSNIIFVAGAPKLADIGLVTSVADKVTFVGTEGYLPPEGPGEPSADLYALGRVLYEAGMGKTQDHFPELPTHLRELPEAPGMLKLNSVILKACEFQPARRYRSAREFAQALSELQPIVPSAGTNGAAKKRIVVLAYDPAVAGTAEVINRKLQELGASVSRDVDTELSIEWARNLEQQIRDASLVIILFTRSALRNERLAYAMEQICSNRSGQGCLRVLPVWLEEKPQLPRLITLALENRDTDLAFAPGTHAAEIADAVVRTIEMAAGNVASGCQVGI